jgi:hypothetical protein
MLLDIAVIFVFMLYRISLYEYATMYLHLEMDGQLGCSRLVNLMNSTTVNILVDVLRHICTFGMYLEI